MSITIGEDCLFNMQFADDQAVITQDSCDLQFMLSRLYKAYETRELNVSVNKTDYLVINSDAILEAVSYTHLDVYKRQLVHSGIKLSQDRYLNDVFLLTTCLIFKYRI